MAGRDITEGRAERSIAVDVGVVSSTAIWQNTGVWYNVALGGMPFISKITDENISVRQTAPFRKEQFDSTAEPGEQTLTGWWLRSQMSFHSGSGIKFFDPATNDENGHYRFTDSKGVNVWNKGEVTLLKTVAQSHEITGTLASNGRSQQQIRPIKWGSTYGVLVHDEYDVDKIQANGTVTHFIDYNAGTDYPVYGICDDGLNAYWVTNNPASGGKLQVYKKALTGDSTTANTPMFSSPSITVNNAALEYVKQRIVACINNAVYEFTNTTSTLPTALYTHPNPDFQFTSVTASSSAIYVAGYAGLQSSIFKFTLSNTGTMPTLSTAIVAAELPTGEVIQKISYYLGRLLIGTNKGIRAAIVDDTDGSITYGPLIVETTQPCYDFAARDHYVWCATGVNGEPGVIRLDLSNEIESLRYAYANDIVYDGITGHETTACGFIYNADNTINRLAFATAKVGATNGYVYIESASTLRTSGYLTTGYIRFGTLEPKNFKRLLARGDYSYGSMTLETVDADGLEYDHISYDSSVGPIEVTTNQPDTAQEYVAYKFILYRDATDTTKGPVFKGYQVKATIATPRQRLLTFSVYNFDIETDKYNVQVGYQGRAHERILQLESIEESGDIVTWQDLDTKESRQVQIEAIKFTRNTPPDKNFDGYGGVIDIVVRTV